MQLIYDVGVAEGEDTATFLSTGATVIGVEANPMFIHLLKQKFSKEIAEGRFVLVAGAITDPQRPQRFYQNLHHPRCSSLNPSWYKRGGSFQLADVPPLDFRSIIEQYGVPDYLKIDIEGSDHLCFPAIKDRTPRYISVEANTADYIAQLLRLGYRRFKPVLYDRAAPRLFGPQLDGWLTAEQTLAIYKTKQPAQIYDFHATTIVD